MLCHTGCVLLRALDIEGNFKETITKAWQDEKGTCGKTSPSHSARKSNQSILKEVSPGCSLEGMMLKLKLQYFGHLMRRTDSLEKTLMLGKIEGRRRRGWQRMRWLDGEHQHWPGAMITEAEVSISSSGLVGDSPTISPDLVIPSHPNYGTRTPASLLGAVKNYRQQEEMKDTRKGGRPAKKSTHLVSPPQLSNSECSLATASCDPHHGSPTSFHSCPYLCL